MEKRLHFLVALAWLWLIPISSTEAQAQESAEQELIFPVVANGLFDDERHYQSTFTFLNLSDTTAAGTLAVYDDEGVLSTGFLECRPVEPPPDLVDWSLPGLALNHVSGITDGPLLSGWGELIWAGSKELSASAEITLIAGEPRSCQVICNRTSSEIVTSVQIPAVRPARGFQNPVTINPNRHTAMALVNPSHSESAELQITLLDSSGEIFLYGDEEVPLEISFLLRPRNRSAQFVWDFFDDCDVNHQVCLAVALPSRPVPEMLHGSIRIESDRPIAVGAVHLLFPEGKLVSQPVSELGE